MLVLSEGLADAHDALEHRLPDGDLTTLHRAGGGSGGQGDDMGPPAPEAVPLAHHAARRPDLARILTDRAAQAGARIRFGTSLRGLEQDDDGALVTFSDGGSGRYDLVVGADGVRSTTRKLLGVDVGTRHTGMGIWRAFTAWPASVTRTDLIYGGPCYIAGYCPTSEDRLYAYLDR